jgi:hypothetical protein
VAGAGSAHRRHVKQRRLGGYAISRLQNHARIIWRVVLKVVAFAVPFGTR